MAKPIVIVLMIVFFFLWHHDNGLNDRILSFSFSLTNVKYTPPLSVSSGFKRII